MTSRSSSSSMKLSAWRRNSSAIIGGCERIVLTTVTRSPLELTLALDPSLVTDGDELPLLTATIPAELVPTARAASSREKRSARWRRAQRSKRSTS